MTERIPQPRRCRRLLLTLIAVAWAIASLMVAQPSQAAKLFAVPSNDPGGPGGAFLVLRYDIPGPAAGATLDSAIVDPTFDQPCCFAFSPSGEMFVTNRGDVLAPGEGSITRFLDPTGTPSQNGTITSPSFNAPHWGAFRQGELLVAQRGFVNVLRIEFNSAGQATVDGAINEGLVLDGPRGVAVNSAGELFVALCCGLDSINRYVFDSAGNATLAEVISGNGLNDPNDIAFSPSGELFAANAFGDSVSRFRFDASGNVIPNGQLTSPTFHGPVGLAFSPWGELFVGNNFSSSGVSRFTFDPSGTATFNGFFPTPDVGLVDIEFAPQPAAQQPSKPGKGCGDKNHIHQGQGACKKPPT
jgi:hypothetical protein